MVRNRLLILLGGCFLAASAAWANDVGYVDCSNHSDDTQVFGKARRSTDVVASLPCGERFTILVYGFVFSRIQTTDGKVGYVYSNLIAVDRSANPVLQPASSRTPVYRPSTPETTAAVAQPNPPAPAQPQPAPAQPASVQRAPAQPVVGTFSAPETTATVARPDPFGRQPRLSRSLIRLRLRSLNPHRHSRPRQRRQHPLSDPQTQGPAGRDLARLFARRL